MKTNGAGVVADDALLPIQATHMTPVPPPPDSSAASDSRRASDARVREEMARLPLAAFLAAQESSTTADYACVNIGPAPADALVATMLSALELTGTEQVLEIGSSSGYETAILSRLAANVVALDSDPASAAARVRLFAALGCGNVRVFTGQGPAGWPDLAPYQAILIGGGVSRLPQHLVDQLDLEGRLVVPLGDAQGQLVQVVRKHLDGIVTEAVGTCHLPMLPWPRKPSHFPWTGAHRAKPAV